MARVATGGILHETHTFAPTTTGLESFRQISLDQGPDLLRHRGTRSALGGILDGLAESGDEIVPLVYASAMPSGTVSREAYQVLRASLLGALEESVPVDGVALALHGAMVAEDELDCEGDILAAVRHVIGKACPLVATLDMHGNVSPRMVENADVLVAFNTNPHLDAYERGREAVQILLRLVAREIRPVSALARPPLLLSALATWTKKEPLSAVHGAAEKYQSDPRVIHINVMGGFAYADTLHSGASVIVTTDGDLGLAQAIGAELAAVAWKTRAASLYKGLSPQEAVRRALASARPPVVLADVGDNVGGGSPGDGTILLRALLEARVQDAVVVIADAEAAAHAAAVGEGGRLETAVGGKQDGLHGQPVWVQGIVERITDGQFTISGSDHFANLYGGRVNMGVSAVIRSEGMRILVTSHKTPPGDLNQLRSQGIEPACQRILVVKSAVAFRGAYEPVAGEIFEVDTPGLCSSDLGRFKYQRVPRPIYPLDAGIRWMGDGL